VKKTLAKQDKLPLQQARKEGVFRRKDSRFWQARFYDAQGSLVRLSTGTTHECAAREWLAVAKRSSAPISVLPPPENVRGDTGVLELFTA